MIKEKQTLDREMTIVQEQSRLLQERLKDMFNELTGKSNQVMELEKRLAILTHQNEKLKSDHDGVIDSIEILRHEKMFLMQEKAELQGQLKQLTRKQETI